MAPLPADLIRTLATAVSLALGVAAAFALALACARRRGTAESRTDPRDS